MHKRHIVLVRGEIAENSKIGKRLVHYTYYIGLGVIVVSGRSFAAVSVVYDAADVILYFIGIVVIRLRHIHILCITEKIEGKAVIVIASCLVPEVRLDTHICKKTCKIKKYKQNSRKSTCKCS